VPAATATGRSPSTNRAAVLVRPREIVLERRPVPAPGPREVLVEVTSVGVCGSDVHWYEHGRIGDLVVEAPLVLGHGCAEPPCSSGWAPADRGVPVSLLQSRELWLTGTFRYAGTYPTAIALAAHGRVDVAPLITGHYDLEQTEGALLAGRTDPAAIKVMVHPSGRGSGAGSRSAPSQA
jgi:threonine dehydrogenase-like Zn-dependent dehydrogenase